MIYNYSQTCFIYLVSIIRAKITLNKCMQHSCFTSMFHMFRSMVSVIIYMIRHVWLGCLMMHNMHDLQCLNACITPGCYKYFLATTRIKYQNLHPRHPIILGYQEVDLFQVMGTNKWLPPGLKHYSAHILCNLNIKSITAKWFKSNIFFYFVSEMFNKFTRYDLRQQD